MIYVVVTVIPWNPGDCVDELDFVQLFIASQLSVDESDQLIASHAILLAY